MAIEWGDAPNWVAAISGTIAAVAAVAVWRHERGRVAWTIRRNSHSRDHVVNVGTGTARRVRLRVGSASDPADSDTAQELVSRKVQPGEALPFISRATYGSAKDYSVNITWGLLRRRQWTYQLI